MSGGVGTPAWIRVAGRPWELAGELESGTAEVWMCSTPVAAPTRALLEACLCEGEAAQAARFLQARDRELYVAAHGILRLVLGSRTGADPRRLEFRAGRWGKPALVGPAAAGAPEFNIAHSGRRVLLAFAKGMRVGVDVELHRPFDEALEISDRFFGPRETKALRGLEGAEREAAFFRLWTRKEAVVKAAGLSVALLSRELELLPVGPGLGSGSVSLAGGDGPGDPLWWRDLPMELGYSAALASSGEAAAVRLWRLDADDGAKGPLDGSA